LAGHHLHLSGVRAGVLGLQRVGDAGVNAVLLGQALAFATPGKSNVRGVRSLRIATRFAHHRFLSRRDLTWFSLVIVRVRLHISILTLETSVMDRQVKVNWTLIAVVVCASLATGASFAAGRGGKSGPQSGEAVSHPGSPGGRLPESGGVANKSGVVTGGQNSDLAADRNDVGNVAERPSAPATVHKGHAAKGRADEAGIGSGPVGKSAGEALGIDLVRPDDGYANAGMARRAARSSLIPTSQRKRLQIVPPVPVTPHLRSPAGTSFEPLRNSAGLALPLSTGKPDSMHTVPSVPGLAKNSLGISVNEIRRPKTHLTATSTMAPVTGINGTTMDHAGVGGVGGPAKDRSGINGSAFHHKF
jgi:hypothetical protein